MSPKILAQAGNSLADVYDVEGSIAGIDQLETRELPIVHEMGQTVFSERLSGSIRRQTTGAINQSTAWDLTLADLPATPFRILNLLVVADAARVSHCNLALQNGTGREIPIFMWDTGEDTETTLRLVENGAAISTQTALTNNRRQLPSLGIGSDQPQIIGDVISFRGQTTAFGAGTVTVVALVYVAFSQLAGISSRGVPIPGW